MTGDDWWNCIPTAITLNDEDWEQFMKVMTSPAEPTEAAKRGAQMLRDLYGKPEDGDGR